VRPGPYPPDLPVIRRVAPGTAAPESRLDAAGDREPGKVWAKWPLPQKLSVKYNERNDL